MRRVLLVHQPVDGGVARHVADLAVELPGHGYETVLCGPDAPVSLRGRLPAGRQQRLMMSRSVSPRSDAAAVRSLARIIRQVRPDLIHAHSSKAGAVARLCRLVAPRTPIVYTPHLFAMAGWFEHESERAAYRAAEAALGVLTSRLIAVCEAEAALARSVIGRRRVRVVYNGVGPLGSGDPDPAVSRLGQRGPLVCTVAQLRPQKGVATLIDAWPAVVGRVPRAQLAVAGGGELRAALEQRTRSLGIAESVHFLGEHPEPLAVLRAADVFVLPSWAEAFPYAILEAMALALAIVATDVGGVAEAITTGETGVLVGARDPAALGTAVADLLADTARTQRLGAAARAAVTSRFTIDAMVRGVAEVYDELLRR